MPHKIIVGITEANRLIDGPFDRPGDLQGLRCHIRILRAMEQRMVHEHEGQHGFGDRGRADADAGIVTAVRFN